VLEAAVEHLDPRQYGQKTLKNLCLFAESVEIRNASMSIWSFENKRWTKWEPENDKAAAGEMLWTCAQKVLKVIYFCNHRCAPEPLEDYIPEEYVLRFFTADEWSRKIESEDEIIHGRILSQVLLGIILPRWQKDPEFPAPFDAKKYNINFRSPQFNYFKKQAIDDANASAQFYGRLGDCVDWETICQKPTDHKKAYDWGTESLACAADIAYRLGFGVEGQAVDLAKLRYGFLVMAKSAPTVTPRAPIDGVPPTPVRPSYDSVPLQEDFGQVQRMHNSKKAEKRAIDVVGINSVSLSPEPASKPQKRAGNNTLSPAGKGKAMTPNGGTTSTNPVNNSGSFKDQHATSLNTVNQGAKSSKLAADIYDVPDDDARSRRKKKAQQTRHKWKVHSQDKGYNRRRVRRGR
jgi:hypothetical protein